MQDDFLQECLLHRKDKFLTTFKLLFILSSKSFPTSPGVTSKNKRRIELDKTLEIGSFKLQELHRKSYYYVD